MKLENLWWCGGTRTRRRTCSFAGSLTIYETTPYNIKREKRLELFNHDCLSMVRNGVDLPLFIPSLHLLLYRKTYPKSIDKLHKSIGYFLCKSPKCARARG